MVGARLSNRSSNSHSNVLGACMNEAIAKWVATKSWRRQLEKLCIRECTCHSP